MWSLPFMPAGAVLMFISETASIPISVSPQWTTPISMWETIP